MCAQTFAEEEGIGGSSDCMTREESNVWRQKLDALDAEDEAISSRNMDTAAGVTALSDEGDEGAI
jgi:hypothetical protein